MKLFPFLLLLVSVSTFSEEFKWPDINGFDVVSGRHAIEQDIAEQKAVFVAKTDEGYIGIPIDIKLPQFAIYTDSEKNEKYPVVIIQAERAQEMDMYGAINLQDGSGIISIPSDFDLLLSSK